MPDTNDPRTDTSHPYESRAVRPFNIVDHPLMRCTLKKLMNRIITHRQRLILFYEKGMPYAIIRQEEEIVDLLEAVFAAKQKFLYQCMGINPR